MRTRSIRKVTGSTAHSSGDTAGSRRVMNDDRAAYDIHQALLMKGQAAGCVARVRGSSPASSPAASPTNAYGAPRKGTSNNCAIPSAEEIRVALDGLDRAEEVERGGNKAEALKIYELAIDRLITYLNATSPTKSKGKSSNSGTHRSNKNEAFGLDRDAVAERVRVALTEAERLKAQLSDKQQSRENATRDQPNNTQVAAAATTAGLTGYLSSTLTGWISRENSSQSVGQAASEEEDANRRRSSVKNKAAPATISPPEQRHRPTTKTSTVTGRKASTSAVTTSPTKQTAQSSPQRRHRRSNIDYRNDPFVKTIKDDMYVDGSSISVTWDDVAGLNDAKRSLQEAAILPLLRPDLYTGLRSAPKGILLYGPPGTGKTMLVKAVAHESDCILFACSASSMTSKWHGEGEKLVRTLFKMAADVAPSIIFFDEIDALTGRRGEGEHEASRRFKTELMQCMDGVSSSDEDGSVLVLACSNCPWDIDDAVMRRFQRRIYIPLPDTEARTALLRVILKKAKKDHNLTSRSLTELVRLTDGYSCSDISSIAQEAAFGPLRSLGIEEIRNVTHVRPIDIGDFRDAIKKSKKSVTRGLLEKYDSWEKDMMK